MSRRFHKTTILTIGFCIATTANIRAKPPETTPCPETQFKVLSPLAQEYHQPDEASAAGVFVPLTEWSPVADLAQKAAKSIANSLTGEIQWARLIFEMAEEHRRAGDWKEARIWYAGVQKLYPKTIFAQQAAERLERYHLLRIAAEAGEEQSEEPPMAGAKRPERLTVMPREVIVDKSNKYEQEYKYERLPGYIGP